MDFEIEKFDRSWWVNESPLTDRFSLLPTPGAPIGSVFTVGGIDPWGEDEIDAVTFSDWLELLTAIAGDMFAPTVTIRMSESVPSQRPRSWQWQQVRRSGDYALELSQMLQFDNTYGARLVNHQQGTVLQYQPLASSSNVAVWLNDVSPISSTLPIMTVEHVVEDDGAFAMHVDDEALLAMDEFEREAEARYRAACELDDRALSYYRD